MSSKKSSLHGTALITIDVEDWFQVENLRCACPREKWEVYELRVVNNTQKLLKLFDEYNVRATFFVLGWIAEKCPELIREIRERDHEVASHGYKHQLCTNLSAKELRADLMLSKSIIEDIIGEPILGYRAPSFSITKEALDILSECGYKYDSSYNNIRFNNRYGQIGEHLYISSNGTYVSKRGLIELPINNLQLGPLAIPWGGGGYFRMYPTWLYEWGTSLLCSNGKPFILYMHPWEIDPAQPRIKMVSFLDRFRHYYNINKTLEKMRHFLSHFNQKKFIPCREFIENQI